MRDDVTPASAVDCVHHAVITFARNIRSQSWDVYDGLNFFSYSALEFIETAECAHALDLARAYGLDKSTVSRQVTELVEQGLITRSPDPHHSRRQRLRLTGEGRRRLRRTRSAQRAALRREFASWDAEDVRTFSRLFSHFANSGHDEAVSSGGDPASH